MSNIDIYNNLGKKIGDLKLEDGIFDAKINDDLVHLAVNCQLANQRFSYAHTKIRSEVRGGGAKPFKQKGTGRARAGSSRSPIWIGGGITFGPRSERNFSQKINRKAAKKALMMVLSDKLINNRIILLDKIEFSQIKSKIALEFLNILPIEQGSILMIISEKNKNIQFSYRNIPYVKVILADSLNILDIIKHDFIVTDKLAMQKIYKVYLHKDIDLKIEKSKKTVKTTKKKPKTKAKK